MALGAPLAHKTGSAAGSRRRRNTCCERKGMVIMNEKILEILDKNAEATAAQIATMLDVSEEEVIHAIEEMTDNKTILARKAIINWEKTGKESVRAVIELKVTPQREFGFDRIAERIYKYPQVKSLYLMSGAYDLLVMIEGRTLNEVAQFVSQKLAQLDSVLSTATHFMLKTYKDEHIIFEDGEADDRQVITL